MISVLVVLTSGYQCFYRPQMSLQFISEFHLVYCDCQKCTTEFVHLKHSSWERSYDRITPPFIPACQMVGTCQMSLRSLRPSQAMPGRNSGSTCCTWRTRVVATRRVFFPQRANNSWCASSKNTKRRQFLDDAPRNELIDDTCTPKGH